VLKKKLLLSLILVTLFWTSLLSTASAAELPWNDEDRDYDNKLYSGKEINYWIDPGNEYTASIPNAVQKLMYPSSGSNPLVLTRTTVNQSSKMDFYQYDLDDGYNAYAMTFRKNSSGEYYAMSRKEKDSYDWIYGEIHLNDNNLTNFTPAKREVTIIHEMLHVYGLKDLYDYENKWSIMYYSSAKTATGVTNDANYVLNAKY
jgi:hypothetical protein